MSKELDVRARAESRLTPEKSQALRAKAAEVSDKLAGTHTVSIEAFDADTGNASRIVSKANAGTGDYVQRALNHVQAIAPVMGLTATQAAEYVADPTVLKTSAGAAAVNLQQRYRGIPIFEAASMVRFAPDGTIVDTVGHTISVVDANVQMAPNISVKSAVLKAAQYVAAPDPDADKHLDQFGQPMTAPKVDVSHFEPKVRAAFTNTPEQSAVLEAGPFGADIKASLIWFPVAEKLKLGWLTLITMPGYAGQYNTIVDAATGDILYCHQLIPTALATGNVYRVDGGSARVQTDFPRAVSDYGLPYPVPAQNNWRWCNKCQALYFAGGATQGVCAAGGTHSQTGSGDYFLVNNAPAYPGQSDWRWCHKCQGIYFHGGGSNGVCKAGGTHDSTGSGNYSLINQSPLSPGQHGWRWCHKCQSLYFSGNATQGVCPAGGAHDATGSGDYSLILKGNNLPAGFPDDWVSVDKTVGNSTKAHLGDAGASITGTMSGGKINFNPSNATGDDQKVLNIFYYCCYMHDFSYLLGFRESDGNFQINDFGRGGVAGDSVDARSFPGAVWGTANMSSPVDGTNPVMNMGLVTSTNRHTAFDSTVVFHEFQHGISGRLIGGPMDSNSLGAPQSGGMNEGWSDYMACSINNVIILGQWVLNNTGGVRGFPYNSSFPDNFGSLGSGRYAADASGQPNDPHNVGEIWCATLMEMNRMTDRHLAMQLVIDAQKLTAANPSFLTARDAILLALDHMLASGRLNANQRDGAWQGIWAAFCKFGQGPQASSNGTKLTGNVADFTLGQQNWRWCHKCEGMYFAGGATQGVCPAGGAHDHTGSGNYDIVNNWAAAPGQNNWRWCHKCQGMYFAGNATQGVCKAGGTHDSTGSGNYTLIQNAWGTPAQNNWRWCKKCQGLYYGGHATQGSCPAGGAHDHTGSGDYSIWAH
jgi:hypothetical protein